MTRILYVDDEADIREVAQMSLELEPDFEVQTCASGAAAIGHAAAWQPDLVLLDVMMPGMDGPTVFSRLREQPETATIPVVFITARTQAAEVRGFLDLGARGVLAKPFDPMTLSVRVRELLG
ncbi:CheY-like chemotaxis protein [Sphingomonas naasensis]|uniref:Response regulator n=1 Tax=Sphingomonas naasensis TaxID=1344951 RepID=A0A4S1WSA3_9SPHN|nr:response regulator [Sphingomonas naasensis]NIJ18673.1 CheY-like chemotaxis protein [Sphingomonas naasensis]TGX45913.1 response regulator [Sphingomonas naasensis]